MPQPVRALTSLSALVAATVAALVCVMVVVGNAPVSAAASGPESATVTLTAEPRGAVSTYTKVTFTIRVTPRATAGIVRLLANGLPIGAGILTSGPLSMTTSQLPLGTLSIVAELTLNGRSAPVTSSPVILVVAAEPQIWLTSTTGVLLPPGGGIRGGTEVMVHLAQFRPMGVVDVYAGTRKLVPATAIDASGGAVFGVTIPNDLASSVNLLTVFGEGRTASFPFYVSNQPGVNDDDPSPSPTATRTKTPSPTPTRTKTPSPAPSTTGPDNQNLTVVIRRQSLPDTGGDPNLAHTGSDAQDLLSLAAVAFAAGIVLVIASSRRRSRGRHLRA